MTRSTPDRSTPPTTIMPIFIGVRCSTRASLACALRASTRASLAIAMSPVVSIILPTYDRLPLLREAVGSVLAQTVTDWELIVVDDGSSDGSADWIESLDDRRVQVIREAHSGNRSRLR